MNMQQNMGTWHAMYSYQDRQKVVQILVGTLKEIQGGNYDAQKANNMAQEFEKFTFMKSPSRDDYLRAIKQKIGQLRSSVRQVGVMGQNQVQAQMNQGQNPMQNQVPQNQLSSGQNQVQQSQVNPGQNQQGQVNPGQMGQMGQNFNMGFLQRPEQTQNGNGQPNQANQLQQVISNMIKNVPIPPTLLAKIPSLPPNCNTWSQVFDCFQKKIIPPSAIPVIREIHNAHMQLALSQHQQRLNQMKNTGQGQGMQGQNFMQKQQQPQANFNMNNMNPQQKQQFLQRQMQNQQSMPNQNQPQTQAPTPAQPQMQNQQRPPNPVITPDDIVKYSSDALALLTTLQNNGSVPQDLDQTQKQSFIRKYIHHQKLSLWKQQTQQQGQNQPQQQVPAQNNQGQNQRRMNMSPIPGFQQPQQVVMPMKPNQNQPQNPNQNQSQVQSQPQVQNQQVQNQQNQQAQLRAQNGNANAPQTGLPNMQAAGILPPLTDDMKLKLRRLFEEVSRNNVALKDVTMLLSPHEKSAVAEQLAKISQQYANVDTVLSYFYVLTKNLEGTKRLIQMKQMTRNIVENFRRGVYLAGPDLLDKLRTQYQKYFDCVKEQIAIRRQAQGQNQNQVPGQVLGPGQGPGQRPVQVPSTQNQNQNPMQANHQFVNQASPQMRMGQGLPVPVLQPQRNINSSPTMNTSPVPVPNAPKTKAVPAPKKAPIAARRKNSKGAATPAATPATLANAIKTPNSISTPHLPQSNKNTPTGQSPTHNVTGPGSNPEIAVGEIFSHQGDSKAARRREMSNSDPEKFFFASLANLLEIDNQGELITPSSSGASPAGKKSPLSPNVGAWTCEVRKEAITSAFKQVDSIREVVSNNVIEMCADLGDRGVKREKDHMDDFEDIDMLFDDKKIKTESDYERRMFEPTGFDEWKSFIVGV